MPRNHKPSRRKRIRSVPEMTFRMPGGKRVFDSKKLLKAAELINDKFQSLSVRAAYVDASEDAKSAKRAYAREAKRVMARLARAARKSDDPFLGHAYFDKWTEKLERASS